MEKKIERVPYISKWYKEELDWSQLFKFDFKDEPTIKETAKELNNCFKNVYFNAGSDWDVDNVTTTTIGTNKVNYIKNDAPILEYVCHLTKHDIYDLKIRLCSIHEYLNLYLQGKFNWNQTVEKSYRNINDVIDYLENKNGIRDQCQKNQLDRLIEKQNQKPYGTLGEHWKELIYLFDFKKNHSFYKNALQSFIEKYKTKDFNPFKGEETYFSLITEHETKCLIDIANSLGIEFIEDFVKACEKCEE